MIEDWQSGGKFNKPLGAATTSVFSVPLHMQHMLQSHSIMALSRLQLKLILNLSRFSVKTSRYDEMEGKKRKVIKSNVKKHEYL